MCTKVPSRIYLGPQRGIKSSKELNQIAKIIENRKHEIEEAWYEHFSA